MRIPVLLGLLIVTAGCSRITLDTHLDAAYQFYDQGNCEQAILELSRAERSSRSRNYIQPEISMLRAQCLERQVLYVDAAQIYQFIVARYPTSEYAYRAKARLDTLQQLGHLNASAAKALPAPL
ncbi:tetratricopeptide repeat protein [Pseudomonas sp. LRF_L74]|uniref:tetratricopeptide repeat protein n=1 Tax=Pseudomonas sp. LRF_L74 TaxID=3369422 RepID=UPI003F5E7D79